MFDTLSTIAIVIAIACALCVIGIFVIALVIKKKYALNWFQQTLLENKNRNSEALQSCHKVIKINKLQREDNSNDDDDSTYSDDDNKSLLWHLPHTIDYVQPKVAKEMGSEESRLVSRAEAKNDKYARRNSAPVVAHKVEIKSHKTISSTKSCPHKEKKAGSDTAQSPLAGRIILTEEFASPLAKTHSSKRRASMQDRIDASMLDPSLYQKLDRAPTIKEESSIDINEPIGIIHMSVQFSTETGLLTVSMQKADLSGFPSTDIIIRNPYFMVFVVGSSSPTRHTKLSEDPLKPIIEETFLFEVGDNVLGKKLVCNLYDYDQFVKADKIGFTQLRLSTLPHNETITVQKYIDRCTEDSHSHDENYIGELLFSMNYIKQQEKLNVVIVKAKDLHIEDELAVLGLMVKITVLHDGKKIKKKRTANTRLSTCPSWNEPLFIHLIGIPTDQITVVVDVCKDKLSSSEVIGRTTIGPESSGRELDHWNDVFTSQSSSFLEWWHQLVKFQ